MTTLNQKEQEVLDQIARNPAVSQRELSRTTGVSLGLVNVILRRFITTGYLQVSHLNKRKLEYLLTPQGFLAVARRTYQYATRTIRNYQRLQDKLSALLGELHKSGYDYFSIHGDGELREMIESLVPVIFSGTEATLGNQHRAGPKSVVLSITAEPMQNDFQGNVVNILKVLGDGQEARGEGFL